MEDKDIDKKFGIGKDNNDELDIEYFKINYGIDLLGDGDLTQPQLEKTAIEDKVVNNTVKQGSAGRTSKKSQGIMELYDWLQCIVSAVICGILVFVFVGRVIGVDGWSMYKTLYNNDKIIMSDLFYTPKYGDIVVLKTESFGEIPLVKRVIATEGQTIDIDFISGNVSIDGRVIKESYINETTHNQLDFSGPITIPKGMVFVMGDNRNASTDSRSSLVGLVDKRQILGKVFMIIIPGSDENGSRSWSRIGSVYR